MANDRLQTSVDRNDDHIDVEVAGELDLTTARQLTDVVGPEIDSGANVVLDLGGLSFVDSTGLGTLVELHRRAEGGTGQMTVKDVPERVQRLLEITKIDSLLQIAE